MEPSYGYMVLHLVVGLIGLLVLYALVIEHVRRVIADMATQESRSAKKRALPQNSPASGDAEGGRTPNTPRSQISGFHTPTLPDPRSTLRRLRSIQIIIGDDDETARKQHIGQLLSALCIGLSLIRGTLRIYTILSFFEVVPWLHCSTLVLSATPIYVMAKCSLYGILVNRLDLSFSNTVYSYRRRTIIALYWMVLMIMVVALIWMPFGVDSEVDRRNYSANGTRMNDQSDRAMKVCFARPTPELTAFTVFFDMVFMTAMVVMFVRPIRLLFARKPSPTNSSSSQVSSSNQPSSLSSPSSRSSSMKNSKSSQRTTDLRMVEMRLLPLKYTLLSMTAVVTTMVGFIVVAFGFGIALTLDLTINIWCVMAMDQKWTLDYYFVCGPLLSRLHSLNVISEDTHCDIIAMSDHCRRLRQIKNDPRKPIAHKVMHSNIEVSIHTSEQQVTQPDRSSNKDHLFPDFF